MQNLYCPKCGQNLNGNTNLKFRPNVEQKYKLIFLGIIKNKMI